MIIGKSITTLGGGGLKPTIVVTAPTGSAVTCDGVIGIEVSGVWTFTVELGMHTIYAINSTETKTQTKTVLVDEVALYEVTITYSRLPSGYTEVEYIQSTGTQYINTGVGDSTSNIIDIEFSIQGTVSGQWASMVGGGGSWIDRNTHISIDTAIIGLNYGYSYNSSLSNAYVKQSYALNTKYNLHLEYPYTNFRLTPDLPTIYRVTTDSISWDTQQPLGLFSYIRNGSAGEYIKAMLYSCKITKSGSIIRNFVPCINPSNVVGLYDLSTSTFYGNSGSGVFVAGNPV